MTQVAPLFIHATGVACPLGLTAAATAAAMRAGIQRFAELPYRDDQGKDLRGSRLDSLGPTLGAGERWVALMLAALQDLSEHMPATLATKCEILLVVPAAAHDPTPPSVEALAERIRQRLGWSLKTDQLQVFHGDAASSFRLLSRARRLAKQQPLIVCAVDCLTHAHALTQYSNDRRLLTERNTDGFLPAEAAVAMLVSSSSHGTLGAITGLGFGDEPGLLDNDVPLRAEGLVAAAREALGEAGLDLSAMQFRISDATGESYFFKEQALVVSRLLRRRVEDFPLWTPASSVGHAGAAAGFLGLSWALHTFGRGATPGRLALACTGGPESRRACAVLHCGSNTSAARR